MYCARRKKNQTEVSCWKTGDYTYIISSLDTQKQSPETLRSHQRREMNIPISIVIGETRRLPSTLQSGKHFRHKNDQVKYKDNTVTAKVEPTLGAAGRNMAIL